MRPEKKGAEAFLLGWKSLWQVGMQDQDRIPVFLSYLGFIGLLPPYVAYFFLAQTKYSRFHARQGIGLTFVFLCGTLLFGLGRLALVQAGISAKPILFLYGAWYVLYIVCNVAAAVSGFVGKAWKIPGLGRWTREV